MKNHDILPKDNASSSFFKIVLHNSNKISKEVPIIGSGITNYLNYWHPGGGGYNPVGSFHPETPLISMCFKTRGGKVSSIVISNDGTFAVAAFQSGAIYLFDLTVTGNTDAGDIYGHPIAYLDSSQGNGNYDLQLLDTGKGCSHLFVGPRMGSNKMIAIDMESFKYLKRQGSNVKSIINDIKIFSHTEARLRGMVASCVHSYSIYESTFDRTAYSCRYRLLTGASFQSFNIWDVIFEGIHVNDGSFISDTSDPLKYIESWSLISHGTINGPSMHFGSLVSIPPIQVINEVESYCGNASSILPSSIAISSDGIHEDASYEILIQSLDQPIRINRQDLLVPTKPSNIPFSKLENIFQASSDGSVLFSGSSCLKVSRYVPISGKNPNEMGRDDNNITLGDVIFQIQFPLDDDKSTSKGKSRHLRSIQSIECTSDGSYALILTTDNVLYLYSPSDIFQRGKLGKVSITYEGIDTNSRETSFGYLTRLFQINEQYRLKFCISYKHFSSTSNSNESEKNKDDSFMLGGIRGRYLSPYNVILSYSCWDINNPSHSSILKVCRLMSMTEKSPELSDIFCRTITIGSDIPMSTSTSSNGKRHGTCGLCGDIYVQHWEQAVVEQIDHNEEINILPTESYVYHENTNDTNPCEDEQSKLNDDDEDEEEVVILPSKRSKRTMNKSNEITKRAKSEIDPIESSQHQIKVLEEKCKELEGKLLSMETRHKTFFNSSWKLRHLWKEQKENLDMKISEEKLKNNDLHAQILKLEHDNNILRIRMRSMDTASSSGLEEQVASSERCFEAIQAVRKPFCVVCQDYTANVLIVECGHICLCEDHVKSMTHQGSLTKCPLCNKSCKTFATWIGMETL